jgi:hypothetical protein
VSNDHEGEEEGSRTHEFLVRRGAEEEVEAVFSAGGTALLRSFSTYSAGTFETALSVVHRAERGC